MITINARTRTPFYLFEEWLAPSTAQGELQPVFDDWWQEFPVHFYIIQVDVIYQRRYILL